MCVAIVLAVSCVPEVNNFVSTVVDYLSPPNCILVFAETVFHLNHIKHDFFEKNPGVVSVRVYVKKASATNVAFSEKSVAVKFKTEYVY